MYQRYLLLFENGIWHLYEHYLLSLLALNTCVPSSIKQIIKIEKKVRKRLVEKKLVLDANEVKMAKDKIECKGQYKNNDSHDTLLSRIAELRIIFVKKDEKKSKR